MVGEYKMSIVFTVYYILAPFNTIEKWMKVYF